MKGKGLKTPKMMAKMADHVVKGGTQRELADKFDVHESYVCKLMNREEMVPYIERAQMRLLQSLPCAVENVNREVESMGKWDSDDMANRKMGFEASKLVMQAGGIVPTSSQTTVVTNIMNQANVVMSPAVMEVLKLQSKSQYDFIDVKEVEEEVK